MADSPLTPRDRVSTLRLTHIKSPADDSGSPSRPSTHGHQALAKARSRSRRNLKPRLRGIRRWRTASTRRHSTTRGSGSCSFTRDTAPARRSSPASGCPHPWRPTRTTDPAEHYQYIWIDPQRPGRFYALGNLGQYIYVAPDSGIVTVRSSRDWGVENDTWLAVFRELIDRLKKEAER